VNNRDLFLLLSTIQTRVELLGHTREAEALGADLASEIAGAIGCDAGTLRNSRLESVAYYNQKLDALVAASEVK
jgi:hypothetical protein